MKRIFSVFMIVTMLFSLSGCGSTGKEDLSTEQQSTNLSTEEEANIENNTGASQDEGTGDKAEAEKKSLVVYFSWSGNTENVAESIQSQTGSDIFEIVPAVPYSDDYDSVVDLAQEEQRTEVRPAISESIENIEQYDIIYVGYPNWWGDMPMILYTFFDTYDLSGKTIAPFCTSGGSGLSDTVNEIKRLEPDADVTAGLHIGSGSSSEPEAAVSEWLNNIGIVQ